MGLSDFSLSGPGSSCEMKPEWFPSLPAGAPDLGAGFDSRRLPHFSIFRRKFCRYVAAFARSRAGYAQAVYGSTYERCPPNNP